MRPRLVRPRRRRRLVSQSSRGRLAFRREGDERIHAEEQPQAHLQGSSARPRRFVLFTIEHFKEETMPEEGRGKVVSAQACVYLQTENC